MLKVTHLLWLNITLRHRKELRLDLRALCKLNVSSLVLVVFEIV